MNMYMFINLIDNITHFSKQTLEKWLGNYDHFLTTMCHKKPKKLSENGNRMWELLKIVRVPQEDHPIPVTKYTLFYFIYNFFFIN